jgi:hemerythrin
MVQSVSSPPSPRGSSSRSDARRQIDDEHRELNRLLQEITQTQDLVRVKAMLAELATLLRAHFETEEGPRGIHEVVGEQASHTLPAVQRLFEEHRTILTRVEQLRIEVADCLDGPVRRTLGGVTGLVDLLHRHEADEEELFAGSFYTDLGGHA